MNAATIDYDALATQHGGTAAVDYDALAAAHGGAATAPQHDYSSLTANPKGEGTYAVKAPDGQTIAVPYSNVPVFQQLQGFSLEPADAARFQKDAAADPKRPTFWNALTNPVGGGGREQGVGGGVLQVGGQAINAIAQPFAHPIDTLKGVVGTAVAASQGPQALGEQVVTPLVQKYLADKAQGGNALALENLAGQAIGTVEGGRVAGAAMEGVKPSPSLGPVNNVVPSAVREGVVPATVNAVRESAPVQGTLGPISSRMFPTDPSDLMTRAVKPGKNNVKWESDVGPAVSLAKSAEADLGHPVISIDDALDATALAKKKVWAQVQQRLGGASQMGTTIDMTPVANAMMSSIDKRMAMQNPGLVGRIQQAAAIYRQPMTVEDAENFIQSNNKELIGYYAKNKVSQAAAEADPEIAAKVAEGNALRDALYGKLDELTGPGSAQLKKAYGSLTNLQKEMTGRQIVYARQAPVSLGEQLGYLHAAGKIATGNIVGGMKDIAVRRFLSDLNDTNSLITKAFDKAQPAPPFPMANFRAPIGTARQLPAQSSAPTIIPYYPEMSAGEKSAALLQMLRQRQQLHLPAQAEPFRLPPPQ